MHYVGMQEMFVNVHPYPISLSLWDGKAEKIIEHLSSETMKEPWIYYLHLYDLHMLGYPIEKRLKVGPKEMNNEKSWSQSPTGPSNDLPRAAVKI